MRTMMRQLQAWSAPYRRAAAKYADLVEPLFAIALCALLEGLLRQRSDAPPELAARLTLGLFVAAPVMLAAAGAGYLKSSAARLRAQRPAIALYRVLGGSMARASAQQALVTLLRVLASAAIGMIAAAQLLPLQDVAAPLPFPVTALGALAAGAALAVRAAWGTWNVPASYDLAVDQADDDGPNAGVEASLRALYASSVLLMRRQPDSVTRYLKMINPLLLLAVYTLLTNKHALIKQGQDDDGDIAHVNNHGAHSSSTQTDGHLAATTPAHEHSTVTTEMAQDDEISMTSLYRSALQFETDHRDTLAQIASGRAQQQADAGLGMPFAPAAIDGRIDYKMVPSPQRGGVDNDAAIPVPIPHFSEPLKGSFGTPATGSSTDLQVGDIASIGTADGTTGAISQVNMPPLGVTPASSTDLQVSGIIAIGSADVTTFGMTSQGGVSALAVSAATTALVSSSVSGLASAKPSTGGIISLGNAGYTGGIDYTGLMLHFDLTQAAAPHMETAHTAPVADLQLAGIIIVGQPTTGHVLGQHLG
ncbi:hypothetical protein [Rugamonas sp.]|uniref:hypothetical protein n=1 Tax=Rugamonas sp. TaxID=1926287 RepID=UPI0025DEA373|nr:hypothetical protein [Rugamonas sp.]